MAALGSNGVLVFAVIAICHFLMLARKRLTAVTVDTPPAGAVPVANVFGSLGFALNPPYGVPLSSVTGEVNAWWLRNGEGLAGGG